MKSWNDMEHQGFVPRSSRLGFKMWAAKGNFWWIDVYIGSLFAQWWRLRRFSFCPPGWHSIFILLSALTPSQNHCPGFYFRIIPSFAKKMMIDDSPSSSYMTRGGKQETSFLKRGCVQFDMCCPWWWDVMLNHRHLFGFATKPHGETLTFTVQNKVSEYQNTTNTGSCVESYKTTILKIPDPNPSFGFHDHGLHIVVSDRRGPI